MRCPQKNTLLKKRRQDYVCPCIHSSNTVLVKWEKRVMALIILCVILRPFEKGNDVTFGCRANNDKKVGPITQSEEIKPELTSLITLFSDNSISGFRFHCNWVLALLKVRYPATRSLGNFLIILYSAVLAKFNREQGSV